MLRRAVTASFIVVAFAALSFAQGKPNLSGTWKLNTSKSDFGVLPAPDSQTNIITHTEPTLKVDVSAQSSQGAQNFTMNLTTDGKDSAPYGPRQAKSAANWDGNNLVVNTKLTFNDQDVTVKSVWTLAPDGKTLTQNVHLASAMGETDQKLIYEKQEGGAPMVAATAPAAGGKPNFTGTWKLNVAKSDFGPIPGPDSRIDVIDHNDPAIKINATSTGGPQGDQTLALTYSSDGKEATNSFGGNVMKSTTVWEGNTLVTNGTLKFNDQDITVKNVWAMSADGKTMIQDLHFSSGMGDADQKLILEKQDAGMSAAPAPKTAPVVASAGPHPNFSGVWKLNTAKSDFGVMPAPDMRMDTIDHSDPTLKVSRKENGPEGAREYVLSMTTDGKETVNSLGGADAKITAAWDGPGLVINFKLKIQDNDIAIRQVATLSPDGKTLTNKAHVSMAMGEMDQTEVYDRQQ